MSLTRTDLENYTLDLDEKNSGVLVVTFEPMTPSMTNPTRDRKGWGFSFFSRRAESVLYVKPTAPHWYQRPDFHDWLDENTALFDAYDRVVLVGGSMGGFGALAFAKAMRATEVLSLNPQSTLAKDLAPWESRFGLGMREDWNGRYRDAAEGLHGTVHVIADRYDALDRRHIDRLPTSFHYYNFPFVGHKVPAWLSQVDGLKPLMSAVIDGAPPSDIRKIVTTYTRRRRNLEAWWLGLYSRSAAKGRLDRLTPFLDRLDLDEIVEVSPKDGDLRVAQIAFRKHLAKG